MKGLFIGRFQPFHKGHLAIVEQMLDRCDSIMIGVGSAQNQREMRNPLSGGERIEMIREFFESRDIGPYEIYPIPDINCYPAWPYYVKTILPKFDVVYASSDVVLRLFRSTRVDVEKIDEINRDEWKGSEIRKRIREGEEWRSLVPDEIADYLEDKKMAEYVKAVMEAIPDVEKKTAHLLTKKEKTISTAESCTGGLIAHRLTNVPGSSNYFERGLVTYSNRAKIELLGVDEEIIRDKGAVSREVAEQMAEGVRRLADTDIGLGTTGIAGPGGGTDEKPVGTVYMGLSYGDKAEVRKYNFAGNRGQVKDQTSEMALEWITDILEK